MDRGSYKGRRLNFQSYLAYCFRPYLFGDETRSKFGCGASALSLLTGTPPEDVSHKNNSSHYGDRFMIQFLRDHGFKVQRLTQCNIAAASSKIDKRHVILLSQMFRKREASWGVINKEMYFHNFQIYFLDSLTLIRKPIVSAYLVIHPAWRKCSMEWDYKAPKRKIRNSGIQLSTFWLAGKRDRASSKKLDK